MLGVQKKMKVVLDVGGQEFSTSHSTLEMNSNTFFGGLVRESTSDSHFFIDRDPTHFRHILNALRMSPTFPDTVQGIMELESEARFYSMPSDYIDSLADQRKTAAHQSIPCVLSRMLERMHSMH